MSEQPAPDIHDMIRRVVVQLFPWVAYFYTDASKDLTVRSASTKIHLAGDATDPPVARVGDFVARFWLQSPGGGAPDVLWYSTSTSEPYTWQPLTSSVLAPTIHNGGTAITITTGSAKVTCR